MKRPVTTLVAVVTLLGFGGITYSRIPLEFVSNVDVPMLSCWIPYPGAAPEQVEKEVAIPAEGEFRTIPKVKEVRTWSDSDRCYVLMEFQWKTDMTVAAAEVRDRIERLKLRLPDEVDRILLRRWARDEWAIMWFGLFHGEDLDHLTQLAQTRLRNRLQRIPGVGEVGIHGRGSPSVYIDFDQDKLRSLNLALYEVVAKLRASSFNLCVGQLTEGETQYYVRADEELSDPAELEDLVIGPGCIRVKDVATVSMRSPPQEWRFTMDGQLGIYMSVKKESEANTVETCDAVRAALDEVAQDPAFGGARTRVFDDQSDMIRATISALVTAGKYGSTLALVVLFVFLRRIRATLLVAAAIPMSLTAAFVYMYFAGISFNMITMSAMILSLGMLVDNSIVVMENIHRHHQRDPAPIVNAQRGASEVALAITAATLTTMIVFIPILFMEMGELSLYMSDFAKPVCVALLASLVLALSLVPLAASHILPRAPRGRPFLRGLASARHPVFRILGFLKGLRPFQRLVGAYVGLLGFVIRRPVVAGLLLAALGAVTYAVPFDKVGMRQMPAMDLRQVSINVGFEHYNEALAERTFKHLESEVNALREELGIENVYVSYGPWGGRIRSYLVKLKDHSADEGPVRTTQEVREYFAEHFPDRLPGAELHFEIPKAGVSETQSITLSMRGNDAAVVADLAERFKAVVKVLPDVLDCTTDRESARHEIQLQIDETLASGLGVSPMVVARTVDFALRGARLPFLKRDGREIPVLAQFQDADRSTWHDLDNVAILTRQGALAPLSGLVTTRKARSPQSLSREGGKSVARITVEANTENMTEVRRTLDGLVASFSMPRGYAIDMGAVLKELEQGQQSFADALTLAIILMYLLMAALFESLLLPLSILTTVPLAFIGVYWAMYLTGTPLDMVALIGAILMCGIVVNNGIVIVDHVNQLRWRAGLTRQRAILQAGRDRLRPVLMTALTTILGCVPLAIGTQTGQDQLYSAGRALVGGLAMGTILTLFVVPVAYSLIDDVQNWAIGFAADLTSVYRRSAFAQDSLHRE